MYIEVNSVKLYYEVSGVGKELILLNPNSDSTYFMKIISKFFSKEFKVYTVDRRCTGKSTKDCTLTYEESAKDIYEFITKLNLKDPYVLGISGGASVALNLAINYSKSISKLVLCSRSCKL